MKRFLISILSIATFQLASSQDIVVTNQGDTIECKITRITTEFVHFTVYDQSGIILMRSRLPLSTIQYYHQVDVAKKEDEPPVLPEIKDEDRFILDAYEPPTIRLSLNGGFTYQFGGYDSWPDSYRNQLQTLWNFGGELDYFPMRNVGIGLKYNRTFTKASDDIMLQNGSTLRIRDESVRFNYLGLSVIYRTPLYEDQAVHYFLSGGLINYRTDLEIDDVPSYEEGDTFGVSFGIFYDFMLIQNVGVGAGAEILIAKLSELDVSGALYPVDFPISRIDLTLGIRFYK